MNIISHNNRLLRGAAIPTAGGDVYNSGWEYTPEGEISGYSGSAIYTGEECPCDSAAIVDSAFNKSTAWVDEQNYLTAHQDVTNLPYVQNSALEFSPQGLISGISGSGFYAASAEGALNAETANFAYNAEHADSADYTESAQVAEFATSSLSSNRSDVANYAFSADMVISGWEYDETSAITSYNGSAFKAGQSDDYSGIAPIVVDNVNRIISAESARLGVQEPLYFVEDSNTATVIGIYDSALSGRDWTDDITAASANALNEAINNITAVASANSATYDSDGNKITETYISAHQDVSNLPYVQNSALDYTPGGHLVSSISGDGLYAMSAEGAFTAETANYSYVAETANYVADGWEYNESNEITGYSGSAIHSEAGGEGKVYTGIAPIVVNNTPTTGVISAQTAQLGVQSPLYFVTDTSASTVIGISGLPEVEGVMYESALGLSDGYITGYNGSALSSERSRYAVSSTSANGAVSSQTAAIVTGGWETANGKITGYNGTAFNAGGSNPQVPVSGVSGISITKPNDTIFIGVSGQYIPYTTITTGDSGTEAYNVNKGIRVTSTSGWVEMYNQNKENESEAHLQVGQNYTGNKSFWAEIDGAGGGFLQMNWNSGTIGPNSHSSYADGTTAAISLGNGALVYRSANSALTSLDDEASKVYQLGSERLRFWNQWGSASFGPRYLDVVNTAEGNYWSMFTADGAARFRIYGSAQNSAGEAITGIVDLTPAYINFYDQSFNLRATLNYEEINALKALLNHVSTASANW